MILLDTNVVSELMRSAPEPAVEAWVRGQPSNSLYFSSESEAELRKSLLRDYVNATIGFGELGGLTDKSPKSLIACSVRPGIPTLVTCSRSLVVCSNGKACT